MKRLAINTATVLATVAALFFLWEVRHAVLLFLLSLGVAASLRPIVRFLARWRLPQWLATVIAYLAALSIPAALLLAAGQPLLDQMRAVVFDVGRAYDQVERSGVQHSAWRQNIITRIPAPEQLYEALVGESGASVLSAVLGGAFSMVGMAIDLALVIFLSIYWSIDRVHFERLWLSLLPARRRAETRDLWRAIEERAGAYVRSEAIQAFSAAAVLWLGYIGLGQPYPALLALICGLAWLIPWVGSLIALTAVALLSLPTLAIDGGAGFLTVTLPAAAYTFAVLLALELEIEPRIFNRRRYNALVTAIVAIGMAEIWGLFGLLLGPPVSAIFQIAAWQWINRHSNAEIAHPVAGSEAFEQRLRTIRDAIDRAGSRSPEMLSYLDRLERLIRATREISMKTADIGLYAASGKRQV